MNFHLFCSTFAVIFLAELPDKTAFAALLLATRKKPWAVFTGSAAAFAIQSLVAVLFGSVLGLLPHAWVQAGSGVLFLVFAGAMLIRKQEPAALSAEAARATESEAFWKSALTAFFVIFVAEWGDLTQFATAALQAKYRSPGTLLLASVLALWCSTGIVIAIGHHAGRFLPQKLVQRLAAATFLLVGVVLLIQSFV